MLQWWQLSPVARDSKLYLGSDKVHEQEAISLFLGAKSLCANIFEVREGLLMLQWALNLTPSVSLQCLSFVSWLVSMKQC